MPGPGLDLVGDEELAEITDAILARSKSFAIGVLDANLAPFELRMRDSAELDRRQADRFIAAYGEHVS